MFVCYDLLDHVLKIDDGTFSWNLVDLKQENKTDQKRADKNDERLDSYSKEDEVADDKNIEKDMLLQRISLLVHPVRLI